VTAQRPHETGDEFLGAARQALRRASGAEALHRLGWWDLLEELDDPDARGAVFALFRAQGRELASSAALGALMAHPYGADDGAGPASMAAALTRHSVRRGQVTLVVGDLPTERLLVDRPGSGAIVVGVEDIELRPVHLPGRVVLHEVQVGPGAPHMTIAEAVAEPARCRSRFLGRIAIALEILGAAEGALALAVDHARDREQFGRPIGSFQAVRHLLAWAETECVAVAAVGHQAVALDRTAPPRFDGIVKALAGRNGRRVCERALQVLGAVGFTAEHDHHQFHSRVLMLDSLLTPSAALTRELGAALRLGQVDPRMPAGLLLPGASW
jgi:hypothetical protein